MSPISYRGKGMYQMLNIRITTSERSNVCKSRMYDSDIIRCSVCSAKRDVNADIMFFELFFLSLDFQ